MIFDSKGYLYLTDFGIAKEVKHNNSKETSGTASYMAPEVLIGKNHSFPVDFYAMGVICYECMQGKRPYIGKTRKEIRNEVLKKQAFISEDMKPINWSIESVIFINSLIQRKVNKRLGNIDGIIEIKKHKWFENFQWEQLKNKNLIAPFLPKKSDNFDKKYCEEEEKIGEKTKERYENYLKISGFDKIFKDYFYMNDPIKNKIYNLTKNKNSTFYKNNNNYINSIGKSSKKIISRNIKKFDKINNYSFKSTDNIGIKSEKNRVVKLFDTNFQTNYNFLPYNISNRNINENTKIKLIDNENIENNSFKKFNRHKDKRILTFKNKRNIKSLSPNFKKIEHFDYIKKLPSILTNRNKNNINQNIYNIQNLKLKTNSFNLNNNIY